MQQVCCLRRRRRCLVLAQTQVCCLGVDAGVLSGSHANVSADHAGQPPRQHRAPQSERTRAVAEKPTRHRMRCPLFGAMANSARDCGASTLSNVSRKLRRCKRVSASMSGSPDTGRRPRRRPVGAPASSLAGFPAVSQPQRVSKRSL